MSTIKNVVNLHGRSVW